MIVALLMCVMLLVGLVECIEVCSLYLGITTISALFTFTLNVDVVCKVKCTFVSSSPYTGCPSMLLDWLLLLLCSVLAIFFPSIFYCFEFIYLNVMIHC